MTTYDQACARAATEQGLDPFVAAMKSQTGHDVEVWQTGGFTMVAAVRGTQERIYTVTHEEGYVVVAWPSIEAWDEQTGDDDEYVVLLDGTDADEHTVDRAVQTILDHDGGL